MKERVTLRMIAEKAGVHYSTVSLALNNHPSIPTTTRERVQKLAKKMGYRPDPMLAALVSYRSERIKQNSPSVLAWVDNWPGEESPRNRFAILWESACRRAESFGWQLEEFRLAHLDMTPLKFSRMLRTRNIEGVLVAPMPGESGTLTLEWPWFSAVTVSHTLTSPRLHRVMPHQMHNMQLLMEKLYATGCRRPGLVLERTVNERTHHYWRAAFLDAQWLLPEADRLPPLIRGSESPEELMEWQARHRPDVIVANRPVAVAAALEAAGIRVPTDVGVATPALWPGERTTTFQQPEGEPPKPRKGKPARAGLEITGVDECYDSIGAAAIESIVAMIHRHENGVPAVPKHILIEGAWQRGGTVRRLDRR